MTMQVIAPVTWMVRAFVEPADLRHIIGFALQNPKVLFNGLRFLTLGGSSPSLVVKKKEPEREEEEQPAPSLNGEGN
jgi:hypothetical protein